MNKTQEHLLVSLLAVFLLAVMLASVLPVFATMEITGSEPIDAKGSGLKQWKEDHRGSHSSWEKPGDGFTVPADYSNRVESTKDTSYSAFGTTSDPQKAKDANNKDITYVERPNVTEKTYFSFDITENSKGKCGTWARNLQIFDNEKREFVRLDCRITILDWTDETGRTSNAHHILIQKAPRSSIEMAGLEEATLIWEYFLAGTGKPYKIKSNTTFDDIDTWQYIGFRADQVERQFVSSDTRLSYKYEGGMNLYYNPDRTNYPDRDPRNAMGVAYKTDSLEFTYGVKNSGAWAHFGYLSYAMFNITPNDPFKLVSDRDEKDQKQVLLSNREEPVTYKIRQVVSSGYSSETYMKNFIMEDTLADCLEILSAKVKQDGADCDLFEVTVKGQAVKAEAKASALKTDDFYNKNYDLVIQAKIKSGITEEELKQYMKGDMVTISNTGTVTIDDTPRKTDEVTLQTWEAKPGKTVSDDDEKKVTSNTIPSRLQPFTYDVELQVPEEVDTLSKLEFTDNLEDCLEVKGVKVIADDADVSSYWSITTNGNKVVAAAKNPGKDFAGRRFSLRITAQVKFVSDEVLQTHGHFNEDKSLLHFKNTGKLTYRLAEGEDVLSETNTVNTAVRLPLDIRIIKNVDRYEHQVGDPIHYTVKVVHNTADCDASDVVVKDTDLEHFDLDVPNAKVSGIKDYTMKTVDGGWKFTAEKLAPGQEVTIAFTAKAKKVLNGTTPVNTAALKCFGVPEKQDSEEIYVNSPKMKLTKKAERTSYKVGNTIDYELELSQINKGCFMRDVIFTDTIETKGVNIMPGTIIVLDRNGKDVTGTMDVTIENNTFTVKTKRNFSDSTQTIIPKTKGKTPYDTIDLTGYLKICYSAKAADDSLSGQNVVNTAKLPTRPNTNKELIKDDPAIPSGGTQIEHKVPIVGAELRISKQSDKKTYEVGEKGTYTLKVEQIREDYDAENVVIKDTFQQGGIKIDKDSFSVKHERKDITGDCRITVTDNGFEIHIGTNLAYNESITVTYKVLFESSSLSGESILNAAEASADNAKPKETENIVGVGDWLAALDLQKTSDKKEYEVGDTIHYRLDVTNAKKNTAEQVTVKDSVKTEGIQLEPDSIKVLYIAGSSEDDITKQCRIDADKGGFTIATKRNLPKENSIRVTYEAVVVDKQLAGKTADNIAAAGADNAPQTEKPHQVQILPLAELEISKKAEKELYTISEDPAYTLKVTGTGEQTAKNVIITDHIATKGVSLLQDSITVTGPDGADITKKCKIKTQENSLAIETGKDLKQGESITVSYTVKITDRELAGKKINNLAAAEAENAEQKTSDSSVKIEPPAKLSIEKTAEKKIYKTGDTIAYTLNIKTVSKETARNVVIEDIIKTTGVQLQKDSIRISDEEKDFTKDCSIKALGNRFEIQTKRDLALNKKFFVTYKAEIKTKNSDGKKIINIAAAAGDNTDKVKDMALIKISPTEEKAAAAEIQDHNNSDGGGTYKNKNQVQTGDDFPFGVLLALIILAAIGISLAFRKKILIFIDKFPPIGK